MSEDKAKKKNYILLCKVIGKDTISKFTKSKLFWNEDTIPFTFTIENMNMFKKDRMLIFIEKEDMDCVETKKFLDNLKAFYKGDIR